MPHVVTTKCTLCATPDCIDACSVVSFRAGTERVVIAPDERIDGTMCASECLEKAIFSSDELPPSERDQPEFNRLNAKAWPLATQEAMAVS